MIEITNENNMELMSRYEDNHFELAIVDPPYFSGPEKRGFYGNKNSPIGIKRKNYMISDKSWQLPEIKYYNEVKRVSENYIIWGANYFDFIGIPFKTPRRNEIEEFIYNNPTGWIIWDKCNHNSSFNDYELAYTSFDRPTVIFPYMWNGMMQGKSIKEGHIQRGNKKLNEKRIHPTQKPVQLYKWTLNEYADISDKILDTHYGSGSIGIACYDLGFDLTTCEIEKQCFDDSKKRIELHQSQLRLEL